ncbi:MAG TPA: branched-chain amino acid ABC transporter substrate-binding protein [Miltoncostaea sp.]|nr:branched-chain amino acid ABC transporter substrate-binding protein [Miltoncostaea sp.]
MPGRLRTVMVAAICGGGVLIPAAAGGAATAASTSRPLLVAVEGPQSGGQASNGLDQLRGVQLAVRQVNAHGGVLGRRVRIVRADDRGSAGRARGVARAVIAKGVRFVIGPYNSSVGLENLSLYRRASVLPLWMTSSDATRGAGATVQPMNSQIAPIEQRYVSSLGARRVAMLVDDTPNGAFTTGMAQRLRTALEAAGTTVTWTSVVEGAPSAYYAGKVAEVTATGPDLIYVSTYFPEGAQVARALTAAGPGPRCLMGLANVDNGFIAQTSLPEAQRCVFSGVPAAGQMPSARGYVQQYRRAFGRRPGVWGSFTYDSARILFAAIERAGSTDFGAVSTALRATRAHPGATGPITIDRATGYRADVPVSILTVNPTRKFVIRRDR